MMPQLSSMMPMMPQALQGGQGTIGQQAARNSGNAIQGMFFITSCFFIAVGMDHAMMSDKEINKRLEKDPAGFFFWKAFTMIIASLFGPILSLAIHSMVSGGVVDVFANGVLQGSDYFKYSVVGITLYAIITFVAMSKNKFNTALSLVREDKKK